MLQNMINQSEVTMHSVVANGCYQYKVASQYVKEAEAKGAILGDCTQDGFTVPIMSFTYVQPTYKMNET